MPSAEWSRQVLPAVSRKGVLLRTFLALYALLATFGVAAAWVWLGLDAEHRLADLRLREAARVKIASGLLDRDLSVAASDLMFLANAPSVRRYAETGSGGERERAQELFANMAREKRLYDQVRLLDASGMEVVRINWTPDGARVVPQAELQPKGGRYFFRDSIALGPRQIYVSPLDLNIEHGQVEIPHKPMLRLGTPVFNQAGEKKGVVILNYLGDKLLGDFRQAMGDSPQAMLLNRDGHWLSHPDPDRAWSFMFGRDDSFAKQFPDAWPPLLATTAGSFLASPGLVTFETVKPLRAGQRSSTGTPLPEGSSGSMLGEGEYFWKVVSLVPSERLPSASFAANPGWLAGLAVGALLLALAAFAAAHAYASRRTWSEALKENERQLSEIAAALGEGVYVINAAGEIVFANPEAARLLGWTVEELLGRNAHELFHHHHEDGSSYPASDCAITRLTSSRGSYRSDNEAFWRRDGSFMPVEVSARILLRDGQPVATVTAFQDISERRAAEAKIHELAFYDPLTGLPNRRLLIDRLTKALAQAKRYHRSLGLLFLDLDYFKRVNDTLGHDVGDELLRAVGERLTASVRRGDTVSRQGGDEFVILLAELAAPEDAAAVAEKILATLTAPVPVAGRTLAIGASIGIAIYPVDGTDDVQELMKKADIAMYAAKAAGRNTYRFYTPD